MAEQNWHKLFGRLLAIYLHCLRSVLEACHDLSKKKKRIMGYPPIQKVCLILSSSTSLSMVCMVSRVIIMKGMLWDTAVKGTRGKGIIHLFMWEILTVSCLYNTHPRTERHSVDWRRAVGRLCSCSSSPIWIWLIKVWGAWRKSLALQPAIHAD